MSSGWRDRLGGALGFRLAAWYLAIFLASAAAVAVLTYALLAASLRERDTDAIRDLAIRYAGAYASGGIAAVDRSVSADRAAGRYEPFFLRLARGREAVLYLTPSDWSALDATALDAAALEAGGWREIHGGPGGAPLDVFSIQLADGTRLQVGRSSHARADALARFRARALVILLALVAVAVAGGYVLTQSALKPLRALAATLEHILRTGRMEARVPVARTSDPLGALAGLVNDLLGRIETLVAGMRQSLDNTAHDLRTPLARARSRLEAALDGPRDAPACARALEETLEDLDRIGDMLTTVMDISEAQTGAMRLQRTDVPVSRLFDETLDLYADLAEAHGVTLAADGAPGLVLHADHTRARQVLANVVDNAVKYTPAGGHVRLRAAERDEGIAIEVEDTGIGIPAEELPRIWERLFRGDRSRSERGLGLGLSLVKAVVEAHGGRVAARSVVGAGTTLVLWFPRAPVRANLSPM